MTIIKQILTEGCLRYELPNPTANIRRVKTPRSHVEPFTLPEARQIIDAVRGDFRNYLIVRFFTGLRSGEANGLKWKFIDFERRQILVRETFVDGKTEYTKTDGSQREIDMSQVVFDALQAQYRAVEKNGDNDYVFCFRGGQPIYNKNFVNRIWNPLFEDLEIIRRRPYNMRHTAATLWIASGEAPEWVAKQLGHTTTEMLFKVYSRYVPNLTRRDGAAFDRMLLDQSGTPAT
jgi:integrase